jgi:hypothetical protein
VPKKKKSPKKGQESIPSGGDNKQSDDLAKHSFDEIVKALIKVPKKKKK